MSSFIAMPLARNGANMVDFLSFGKRKGNRNNLQIILKIHKTIFIPEGGESQVATKEVEKANNKGNANT